MDAVLQLLEFRRLALGQHLRRYLLPLHLSLGVLGPTPPAGHRYLGGSQLGRLVLPQLGKLSNLGVRDGLLHEALTCLG